MEDEIRWKVTDPLGNEIVLYEQRLSGHIRKEHDMKDAENREAIEEQVKFSIQMPRFIIKDEIEGRFKYLDLVDVSKNSIKHYRALTVIVDFNVKPYKVVTWFANRSIHYKGTDEELIYDERFQNNVRSYLQVR